MVHVTKTNFLAQLSDFLHHLPAASYIAMDEEMTGISLPSPRRRRPDRVESPGERYERHLKGVPERYSIIQVGVALFTRDPDRGKRRNGARGGDEFGHDDDRHAFINGDGMLNRDEPERGEEAAAGEDGDDESENDEGEPPAPASDYTARVYNFYLFPGGRSPNDREVTMNPSAVKFLLDNHMDFDRVFREGVPYATAEQAEYLKRRHFERQEKKGGDGAAGGTKAHGARRKDRVKLTRMEDIAFVARTMADLREWIDSDESRRNPPADAAAAAAMADDDAAVGEYANGENNRRNGGNGRTVNGGPRREADEEGSSLVLPPCNAFLRRCLYETIEDQYPGLVLERADADPARLSPAAGAYRNQIRVVRLSPAEKERRAARLRREAWDGLLLDLGFATVFGAISDACNGRCFSEEHTASFLDGSTPKPSFVAAQDAKGATGGRRVPLIVHNGLQDLMFLMTHFHDPALPDDFEGTKRLIRGYFPAVYDTKILATEFGDAAIRGGSTALEDLFRATCAAAPGQSLGGGAPSAEVLPPIANTDGRSAGQAHEAAWDAYMTGCAFDALTRRTLESKNAMGRELSLDALLADSSPELLREWIGLNRLYMHASLFTIDLESSTGPVDGLHDPLSSDLSADTTFHVSGINTAVSTRDILRALTTGNESEYEAIRQLRYEIIWVDDNSFFVGARAAVGDDDDDVDGDYMKSLIAMHVRSSLQRGLGGVEISSLGSYLGRKYGAETETASEPAFATLGQLATAAAAPLRIIGRMLGLGGKRPIGDDAREEGARKRRRFD